MGVIQGGRQNHLLRLAQKVAAYGPLASLLLLWKHLWWVPGSPCSSRGTERGERSSDWPSPPLVPMPCLHSGGGIKLPCFHFLIGRCVLSLTVQQKNSTV